MADKKNPHFGATFAERKAARTGEKIDAPDLSKIPKQTTFAERAKGAKAVDDEQTENKAVSSGQRKSRKS